MFRWLRNFRKNRITQTRAVVQYETPWYWRVLLVICVFLAGILIASIFRIAFIENSLRSVVDPDVLKELEECRITMTNNQGLEDIITKAQADSLSAELGRLQTENSQLKADLALYEKLSENPAPPGQTAIKNLEITQQSPGVYKYQLLIAYSPKQRGMGEGDQFKGLLSLSADMADGRQTIVIAGDGGILSPAIELNIRYFERLTGTFELPPDRKIQLFRARIRQGGRIVNTEETTKISSSFNEATA